MIFKVKLFSVSFKFSIKGTGNVKIIVNDRFIKSLSLSNSINIRYRRRNDDSDVYKVQIENIDAKDVTIGPVTKGKIVEIISWGDLDIVHLYKIFEKNNNRIIKLPNYIPKSLTNLSFLFYRTRSCYIKEIGRASCRDRCTK